MQRCPLLASFCKSGRHCSSHWTIKPALYHEGNICRKPEMYNIQPFKYHVLILRTATRELEENMYLKVF